MDCQHGCLVCGRELIYTDVPQRRTCLFCGQTFISNVACPAGHYVCDRCHAADGVALALAVCREAPDRDPLAILQRMMDTPGVHMHGPEHHVMVGAALLCAYHNCGGRLELATALPEMARRGQQIPGGACGNWGCCGAAVSSGIFISIATGATPLKKSEWGLANLMTAASLQAIGEIGGPRCCKRDSFTAVKTAVAFTDAHLGIRMELPPRIVCHYSSENQQCLGASCPYNPGHHADAQK